MQYNNVVEAEQKGETALYQQNTLPKCTNDFRLVICTGAGASELLWS